MIRAPEKILVVQLRRVGDVLFTLPVLGALRKNFPRAKIDFLVERPGDAFVRLNPHVDETLVYDKKEALAWIKRIRAARYGWVLDFLSNGRTLTLSFFSGASLTAGFEGAFIRNLVYDRRIKTTHDKYLVEQKLDLLRALGCRVSDWSWDLALPSAETQWAEDFFRRSDLGGGAGKVVGLAPASRRRTRMWLEERFAEVSARLLQNGHHVLLLWGPGEKALAESIADKARSLGRGGRGKILVPPETSLIRLAALISKCALVLAVDNGPKNTAVALKVPTITIDGPTNPLSFNPPADPAHAVIRDENLFCIGCGLNRCPYRHECMLNVTTDEVAGKIKSFLALPAQALKAG